MAKMEVLVPLAVLAILFVILIASLFFAPKKFADVTIGGAKVRAEIADNPLAQAKGLMFRKSLQEHEGMLFVFKPEEGYPAIWMMNMSIPIDIVWISAGGKVVHIVKDAQPCLLNCKAYKPSEKAAYVLEVKAGLLESLKVKIGDAVKIEM